MRQRAASVLIAALATLVAACSSLPADPTPAPDARARESHREGLEYLRIGEPGPALDRFEDALRTSPLFVEAHRQRQNLKIARLEQEGLQLEYRAMLDAHPRSAAASYLYGRIQYRLEDRLAWFRRARELDPRFAWAHHAEAYVLAGTGRRDEALQAAERAASLDPGNVYAQRLLAEFLQRRGDNARAEGILRALHARDPDSVETTLALAARLDGRQHALEAFELYRDVLLREPDSEEALARMIALARQRSAEPEGYLAGRFLVERAEEHPDDAADQARAALVHDAHGRHAAAAAAGRRAFELGLREREFAMAYRRFRGADLDLAFRVWAQILGIDVGPENPPIARLGAALRGAKAPLDPPRAREILDALAGAGWIDEALVFAEDHEGSLGLGSDPGWCATRDALRAHRRFMSELELFVREDRGDREGADDEEGLAPWIARISDRLERATGVAVGEGNRILGFSFLGEILDLTHRPERSLNGYLARFNQVLVAGRWAGERPQLMLANLAAPLRRQRPDDWPDDYGFVEILAENVAIAPRDSNELGRAFFRAYYVNLDRVAPSAAQRRRAATLAPEIRERLLASQGLPASGAVERQSLALPLDESRALLVRALELHGDLPLLEHVRAHEIGHVRDAASRLPVGASLFSNLVLAVKAGLSADRLGGILEETAQLEALRHGPSPHLALSDIVDFIPASEELGFHHRGYRSLLERFLAALDARRDEFPSIRSDRVLLHQLHHLSEDEIRRIASAIDV
ncbi:MAG: tetratricopeptide repeat protein [Planctomycetota bacterium]